MDMDKINDVLKAAGVDDFKDIAQDVDYLKLVMLLGKLDRKKIKKALGGVDIADAIEAAKSGDVQKIKKMVDKIDFEALKDVLDTDEDGQVADDIKKMIKQIKK